MPPPEAALLLLLFLSVSATTTATTDFIYHGFNGSGLTLSGLATVTAAPSGLLQLTNDTPEGQGQAFHPDPLPLGSPALSFSTSFVLAIARTKPQGGSGYGIAFAISPTKNLSRAQPSEYFGLFRRDDLGDPKLRTVAVEFDTVQNKDLGDIDGNHVGIDVNSLVSNASKPAAYFDDRTGQLHNVTLSSAAPIRAWVDYDGLRQLMNVTIISSAADAAMRKPKTPLLSMPINLSRWIVDREIYLGFTASTGGSTANHYILGWSFSLNRTAQELDPTRLPPLPVVKFDTSSSNSSPPVLLLPLASTLGGIIVLLLLMLGAALVIRRRRRYAELIEDWEAQYGQHRFHYKELYKATGGFREDDVLGAGGFGLVYRGKLQSSDHLEVAVKKVSHDSRQGMREFVAEIASMGRMRHRNLVQLLGYCRRQGELLLVYDYMPNGSLERFLYGDRATAASKTLDWGQRLRVVRGVAAGLLYLHEGWEQVVIHRDIKASNVLLDGELNGKLSDFGLARLHDHGDHPQTTRVVGTVGYLAPEIAKTGKASKETDVYAFGVFLLEVACGRRPMEPPRVPGEEEVSLIVEWVLDWWRKGDLLAAADQKLSGDYAAEEMELVMKLGLMCCHPDAASRPSARRVVQFLDGGAPLPETSPEDFGDYLAALGRSDVGFDDFLMSSSTMGLTMTTASTYSVASISGSSSLAR